MQHYPEANCSAEQFPNGIAVVDDLDGRFSEGLFAVPPSRNGLEHLFDVGLAVHQFHLQVKEP